MVKNTLIPCRPNFHMFSDIFCLIFVTRIFVRLYTLMGLTFLIVSLGLYICTSSYLGAFSFTLTDDPLKHLKVLTWIALGHASAPPGHPKTIKTKNIPNVEPRINTLLLMATIIITVTFAAGITVPGGYDNSEPHKGMALMVKKSAFQVFMIANAVAMYSSIILAVLLIWAQLGILNLDLISMQLAAPFFGGALMMVAVSFMTGVYLVVSNLNWLSYVILIIGLIPVLALSTVLILLFLPPFLNHRMLRYIFYYPFSLLLLIFKKWR